MPIDLLDRLLIINTESYKPEEIKRIIQIKAKNDNIEIESEALNYLTELGSKVSLRYAVQLLPPALEIAKEENSNTIKKKHVERVKELFADINKSVNYLREYENKMLK